MARRLLIFAAGEAEPDRGGSGFEKLVLAAQAGQLRAEIVGVVSTHPCGGVYTKAKRHGIRFLHCRGPWDEVTYQQLVAEFKADLVSLSGWLKLVVGLPPEIVLNIHPGPPEFGGKGMYGHHVHEAVLAAYKAGRVTHSAVFMHFATREFDKGPQCFYKTVPFEPDDTPDSLGKRVNAVEHQYQWQVTDMVVNGEITCVRVADNEYRIKAAPDYLQQFVPRKWWHQTMA